MGPDAGAVDLSPLLSVTAAAHVFPQAPGHAEDPTGCPTGTSSLADSGKGEVGTQGAELTLTHRARNPLPGLGVTGQRA